MTKYTPKWFYLLITILIYLQGCEKSPQNIDVTEGYESIVEKIEDAIQYEIESKDLNAISMVLVDDQKIIWAELNLTTIMICIWLIYF